MIRDGLLEKPYPEDTTHEGIVRHAILGLEGIFGAKGMTATVSRLTSAFVVYFMDREPTNWKEIADGHDFAPDLRYRKALVENGVFHFPLPTKQGSISAAHDEALVDETLEITEATVRQL